MKHLHALFHVIHDGRQDQCHIEVLTDTFSGQKQVQFQSIKYVFGKENDTFNQGICQDVVVRIRIIRLPPHPPHP